MHLVRSDHGVYISLPNDDSSAESLPSKDLPVTYVYIQLYDKAFHAA